MNKYRVIAFVVASIVSTASFAGAQTAAPGTVVASRTNRVAQGRKGHAGPLHGMTLSAAEKSKLKEIRASYKTQAQSLHESLKPAMQDARVARQKGDTAAMRAVMERTKSDREKLRSLMDRQKADLRAALSPEHQKQFDANVQQASQGRGAHAKKSRGRRPNA
jgi:Spy/CpxP family protein refolding chaperone